MSTGLRVHLSNARRSLKREFRNRRNAWRKTFHDFEASEIETIRRASRFTMTSWPKLYGLVHAARYVAEHHLPGSVVECGVWRGGSMLAAALTLLECGADDRDLYLFDTFQGMARPGTRDVDYRGKPAVSQWQRWGGNAGGSDWCRAGIDEVREVMASSGYPGHRIHFVAGKVEDTIPDSAPKEIALLRLDTDWYDSTRHALDHLYPRLAVGGVLIIDDYGTWRGARAAVDEYLEEHGIALLLNRLDAGARIAVKR